jgi:lipoate---protein ligase
MKTSLHVLSLQNVPILQQLRLEEALLRLDHRNWCLINQGSPPAIVMGISGKTEELVCQKRLRQFPLPLIRRFSGGGTVVVDENTIFITFICEASSIAISPFPSPIMQWTAEFYQPLLDPHPFRLKENDYVLGERKFGGNAQSIGKNRWLHHSSLLWDFDSDRMNYLLLPRKMPAYRHQRSHADFLCRLQEHFSSRNDFLEKIQKQLRKQFCIQEVLREEIEEIIQKPHRQATTLVSF